MTVPLVAVVGPTAAGKTALSLDLAEALPGEVVNTDAFQLYRGMDIGTAKASPAERRGIVHHLLDVLEVHEDASVAEFQHRARAVIARCRDRGVAPVLVGGSALYTRAVLDDLDFPGTDPALRARLEGELAAHGPQAMHARLGEADPEAAAHILPTNGRRIVRALEVVELTGGPFRARLPEPRYVEPATVQIGVDIPRDVLDRRIEERVRRMWDAGLVDEVRRLCEDHRLHESRTASRALGYQQVLQYLAGDLTEDEAFAATVQGTRRFARKQDSWFRRDVRVHWIAWDDPARVDKALALVRTVGART